MRLRHAPLRQVTGEAAPLSWPLVDRRSTRSLLGPPNGVNRRLLSHQTNGVVLPYEAISMAPFRIAALAAVLMRVASQFRGVTAGVVFGTLAMLAYTAYALRSPVPSDSLRRSTRRLVDFEQIIVVLAVLVSGSWHSPLAFFLIPTAILAGLVTETAYALLLTIGGAALISALHLQGSVAESKVQTSILWTCGLILVAMVAGLARKAAAETARKQNLALDQLDHLSHANALLSNLHRLAQVLPASLDLDDVLDSTVGRVRQLIEHDLLTILLVNEQTGALEPAARTFGYASAGPSPTIARSPTLAQAMQSSVTLRFDYLIAKQGAPRLSVAPSAKSGVYASLRARGVVMGVIAIESLEPRGFTEQHSEILHGMAEPLGVAIDNARLFRKLRVVGADEERNRIARDLHDKIGSSLASLGFALDGTLSAAKRGTDVIDDLEQIRAYVTTMIGDVREALYDLRSDVNDTQDLASTLRQFADRVQTRSSLMVQLTSNQQVRLPLLQEREIWHIAREAIINVEKHARATRLGIDWVCTTSEMSLTISDNGVGLEVGGLRADSYGMVGMRTRRKHRCAIDHNNFTRRNDHSHRTSTSHRSMTMALTVMLVDDHTMIRQGLRRGLEAEGIRVVAEAGNGEDAIRLALEHRPDVVLMDVSMPTIDGIEATRRLMKADARQRIVMLTMHMDKKLIDQAIRAGAVGYLTKDCTITEVVEAIRLAVNGDVVLSPTLANAMLNEVRSADTPEVMISPREEEVLQLVADGLGTTDIAEQLFISQKTVKNHLGSIYEKLDARDRTQAVLTAVRMGIVRLN